MLQIGPLRLESRVILAPMCGVCDLPYLELLRRFDTRSLIFHEMFSAVGLLHWKNRPRFEVPAGLRPLGLQVFGHDPETMARAAVVLAEAGADVIDINLGCPVPKITKACDGSALLKDTPLLEKILRAMVRAVGTSAPVTIKMRLGWDDAYRNYLDVAKLAEDCGVAMVTVHGRTRSQMYSGEADWEAIGEVAAALSIPVVGNGDVWDPVMAARRLGESGCAGVMIGRGAQGNPWLLPRIDAYLRTGVLPPEPSPETRLHVAREHCRLLIAQKGERTGVPESRKHVTWYTRGLPGSAELRHQVNQTRTEEGLYEVLDAYVAQHAGLKPTTAA
ncbi:MAG: tRNA dihydrouridine synthase DusB [Candidatus Sericytochromatia bacterium]|nr:tRNA dihydrouridine synthase DusB [Candidatus Tanganyikabacteria bacterium]